ncbi:MAG: Sip1-related alpha-galactosidase, partial [Phycisphaerae bacterium]
AGRGGAGGGGDWHRDGAGQRVGRRGGQTMKPRAGTERGVEVSLAQAGWEIATIVPVGRGEPVAVIGLLDKMNSYGAVGETGRGDGEVWAVVRDGGVFGAYCAERPRRVVFEGREMEFAWGDCLLRVEIAGAGKVVVYR